MSARTPEPLTPAEYGRQVRRALDDLPSALLEETLEDLDEHLAEVAAERAAEGGGSLSERLGAPGDYAGELRRAAGLPEPATADSAAPAGPAEQIRRAAARLGRHDTVRSVAGFLPELRPAWWVLRGWLAVLALSHLAGYRSARYPFGAILAIPLIAAAVVLSVRLGRRAQRRPYRDPRQRLAAVAGNAALGLLAVISLIGVQQRTPAVYAGSTSPDYTVNSGGTLSRADGTPITNIYPYSAAGRPLSGVLLYDQDGRAVDNLSPTTGDGQPLVRVVPSGSPPPPANAYPQQQRLATDGEQGLATPGPEDPPGTTPSAGSSTSATPGAAPTSGRPAAPSPPAASTAGTTP